MEPWCLIGAGGLAVLTTRVSDWRVGEFPWWASMTAGILLVLVAGMTRRVSRPATAVSMTRDEALTVSTIEARSRLVTGATR